MKTKDYEKQANDFLKKTGTTIKIQFSHNGKHFVDDKQTRDIYKITISRETRSYTFNFGQSIAKSGLMFRYGVRYIPIILPENKQELAIPKNESLLRSWIRLNLNSDIQSNDKIIYPEAPTSYDILSCLQKYDVGSFEDFCGEFGYDTNSRKAERVYKDVCDEYTKLCTIFSNKEMELLQDIN